MALIGNSIPRLGGGGGTRDIYIGWGVPWHTKKGGLGCGHSPQKRGILGAGSYRHVYNPKKNGKLGLNL